MALDPDLPLSFLWSGITDDHLSLLGFGAAIKEEHQIARRAIVSNLIRAHVSEHWVSYSRNRNHYSGKARYQGAAYTYTNVLRVIDELHALGLIVEDRAQRGQLGWQSRVKASLRLISVLGSLRALSCSPGELIRLRDANDSLVDYEETEFTTAARNEVAILNDMFRTLSISLCSPDICWEGLVVRVDNQLMHPSQISGYRVFNRDWNFGGRLYGPFWQTLPKKRREQLTIDGERTTEHDFAQLHPRLLYAESGQRPTGDAYTIPGFEERRDLVKTAWQMLINARSRLAAIRALATELGGQKFHRQAKEILRTLEEHHQPIARAFYTGAAGRLQRRDSDLMMRIVSRCRSEGFCVLPVHDSFIAQTGRADQTREIMEQEHDLLLASL